MTEYDLTAGVPAPEDLRSGDVLNVPYSGAAVALNLPKGQYLLEVWGAQGGGYGDTSAGGAGGYSSGVLALEDETALFVYVGGAGSYSTTAGSFVAGGFNGGGAAGYRYGGSGGGATDIRLLADSLYNRVIVAGGGGGGWGYSSYDGGVGGGEAGGQGTGYSTTYLAGAGTQTAGGAGNGYSADYYGSDGAFGVGGDASVVSSSYNRAAGGGGGWYGGGGAGYRSSSSYYYRGGGGAGGGSGFVWTGANVPDGYALDETYCLSETRTTAGERSGNGYARITVIQAGIEAPEGLSCTAAEIASIGLKWNAVEDAVTYRVYCNGTLAAETSDTTATVTGLQPGTAYTFAVAAVDGNGRESLQSVALDVYTDWGEIVSGVRITGMAASPNPVSHNADFVLMVAVSEEEQAKRPLLWLSDMYFSDMLYGG